MRGSKAELVRGWLEKARRDLVVAEREAGSAAPFTDIVCFHAQQSAEKSLKAYLTWRGVPFPRTHALDVLRTSTSNRKLSQPADKVDGEVCANSCKIAFAELRRFK